MIKIAKNKQKVTELLTQLGQNILANNKTPDANLAHALSTPERDALLLARYQAAGFEDYQLHQPASVITELPFNQAIDLSFMEQTPNYKPFTIPKGHYELANYSIGDRYLNQVYPLVVFDEDITLPMICEDHIGWMTPVLFEEKTMRPCVERAHGNVLVLGLGIGFFLYNCLLKEEVTHLTVVEQNPDIIELFKTHILPQFPRQADLTIIQGDAYEYCQTDVIESYDYTFIDIWRNQDDGLPMVSNLLKGLDLSKPLSVDFWVYDTIIQEVKDALAIYLHQLNLGRLPSILAEPEPEDFITFHKIHRHFEKKTVKLNNRQDILNFIHDEAMLRELLQSF